MASGRQPTAQVHADVEAGRVAGGALGTEAAFRQAWAVCLGGAGGESIMRRRGDRLDDQPRHTGQEHGQRDSPPPRRIHGD